MGNNDRIKIKQVKDTYLIEPSEEMVPLEDLNISVDLYIIPNKRSLIGIEDKDVHLDGDIKKIAELVDGSAPFFRGSKDNEDLHLTTNYTFADSNNHSGRETLGIVSIDIDFNSSYFPIVSMDMVDIRGRLHEMGYDSPYNAFLNFPYPMFKLVVKGYYGKPVEYLLHLVDYSGSLNSGSGNFDIKCEFTGYNYGYLSDMLLGYLKAVPYTTEGQQIVARKKQENPNFITFNEMYEYGKILNNKILNLKNDDESVKALSLGYQKLNEIKTLKNRIVSELHNIDNQSFGLAGKTGDFVFLKKGIGLKQQLTDFLKEIKDSLGEVVDGEKFFKDLDLTKFKIINNTNYFEGLESSKFVGEDGNILESYNGNIPLLKEDESLRKGLAKVFKNANVNTQIDVVYFKGMLKALSSVITELNSELKKRKINITDSFLEKISNLDNEGKIFDFTIGNYMRVLCDHVDILMEAISMVSKKAEDDVERNRALKGADNAEMDVINVQDIEQIYAFPDYMKKVGDNGVLESAWIGEDHPFIDEVRFVEELYDGMVKNKSIEDNFLSYLDNMNTQWYAINPFDTLRYTRNPWDILNNATTIKDGKILRMLIMRAFVFLGYSVKNPTDTEIVSMAKLEAENLFIHLKNQKVKDIIGGLATGKPNENIRIKLIQYAEKLKNRHGSVNGGKLFTKIGDDDVYQYIAAKDDGSLEPIHKNGGFNDKANFYLPLSFADGRDHFDGDTISDSDKFKNASKTTTDRDIYFGDDSGDGKFTIEDGATYIDILEEKHFDKSYDKPTYGLDIVKENLVKVDSLNSELLNGNFNNILFNGKWNTNEFVEYTTSNGDVVPFSYYFYENQDVESGCVFAGPHKEVVKQDINVRNGGRELVREHVGNTFAGLTSEVKSMQGLFFRNDDSRSYNLFGSDFYYYQRNVYAKALLVLHSLPFKGLTAEDESSGTLFTKNILNLFNKKAGIVQVPKPWVLLIGGLLYRAEQSKDIIEFRNNNGYVVLPYNEDDYVLPGNGHMLKNNDIKFVHSYGSESDYYDTTLRKVDKTILNLPYSVKKVFMKQFMAWAESIEFKNLRKQFEIFKEDSEQKERSEFWISFPKLPRDYKKEVVDAKIFDNPIINEEGFKNYFSVAPSTPMDIIDDLDEYRAMSTEEKRAYYFKEFTGKEKGNFVNFNLRLKDNVECVRDLIDLMNTNLYILNGTYKIWDDVDSEIKVEQTKLNRYLDSFISRFDELNNKDRDVRGDKFNQETFQTTSSDAVLVTIYKNIKSIKDKWISGHTRLPYKNIIESFKFIDRGYNDISDKFKLNPSDISNLLRSDFNKSLYAHTSQVLTKNQFNFIAMPTFIDYSNVDAMVDIFDTHAYSSVDSISKPTFVCMYSGEASNTLSNNPNFKDDGIDYNNEDTVPNDFNKVPAFAVKYGDETQSIFNKIEVTQSEFSETNESLAITDRIAGSYNNLDNIGQNMYNVYVNRAYNSKVDMLGNAMIQPFMYYQLQNVPVFRGIYVVVRVSHSITANHMRTTMTGNRVKRGRTKLLDKSQIFNTLLGNLNDIDTSDAVFGDKTADKKLSSEVKNDFETTNVTSSDENNEVVPELRADMDESTIYKKSYRLKKGFSNDDFDRNSNTKWKKDGKMVYMTYNEVFDLVNKLTDVPVATLKTMSVMESAVGKVRGAGDGINSSGYVGLMQFGYSAADTVEGRINNILKNKIDVSEFEFFSNVDTVNKKIVLAPLRPGSESYWVKGSANHKGNNSFFDDFINTLGAAYLARTNVYVTKTTTDNIVDVYLAHQQGAGTILKIKKNPLDKDFIGKNNPPYVKDLVKVNKDWYFGWAGHLEATAKHIDPNYKPRVGGDIV